MPRENPRGPWAGTLSVACPFGPPLRAAAGAVASRRLAPSLHGASRTFQDVQGGRGTSKGGPHAGSADVRHSLLAHKDDLTDLSQTGLETKGDSASTRSRQ